ncbi:MAG: hypothetical protein HKN33_00325 [Pyrinomonadaceae bacterium]|nr:hypothetical protein [Pyrinomonadaceae bacterium]
MTPEKKNTDKSILKRLEFEEKAVRAALEGDATDLKELQSDWQDKDSASENNIRTVEWEQYSSLQDALVEIQDAKNRIENGTYGICEVCDNEIPKKRLEAVPVAKHCVPCQQQIEAELGQNARQTL